MDFRFVTADEREKLYNEIWTEPVTIVAKRYNISDTGLRKHCIRLGIPLPYSGYWAKVRAGKKAHKVNLPPVTGELRKYVRNYAIKYRADIENLTDAQLMVNEEFSLLKEETKIFIKEKCAQIQVKDQLRNPHRLITEHKEGIKYKKKSDKKLNQTKVNTNYYASAKGEYSENKPIFPIDVSNSNMSRVYKILDALIKTLEDMEGHTRVGQNSGKDTGYFVVMRAAFYFELKEKARKVSVPKNNDEAKTNLVLTLLPKSWFTSNASDILIYEDNDKELLEEQLGRVIYDMFVVANRLLVADQLEERAEKRKREEQERLRRLEKMRKGELEELKLLEQVSSDWDKAQKIRGFTDYMEMKIAEVTDRDQRRKLLEWLKWARDKADWIDPLTEKEDGLLGKSKHIFELINEMDI